MGTHLCRVILIEEARGGTSRHGMEEDTAKRLGKNRMREMLVIVKICKEINENQSSQKGGTANKRAKADSTLGGVWCCETRDVFCHG